MFRIYFDKFNVKVCIFNFIKDVINFYFIEIVRIYVVICFIQ